MTLKSPPQPSFTENTEILLFTFNLEENSIVNSSRKLNFHPQHCSTIAIRNEASERKCYMVTLLSFRKLSLEAGLQD